MMGFPFLFLSLPSQTDEMGDVEEWVIRKAWSNLSVSFVEFAAKV